MEFPIFRTPLWILLQGNKNPGDSFSRSIDIHTSSCLKIWHTRFGGFVRERLVEWVRVLGDLLWVMLWVAFGCCLSLGSAKKKKKPEPQIWAQGFFKGLLSEEIHREQEKQDKEGEDTKWRLDFRSQTQCNPMENSEFTTLNQKNWAFMFSSQLVMARGCPGESVKFPEWSSFNARGRRSENHQCKLLANSKVLGGEGSQACGAGERNLKGKRKGFSGVHHRCYATQIAL